MPQNLCLTCYGRFMAVNYSIVILKFIFRKKQKIEGHVYLFS